jgi:hypothetical protein
MVRLLEPRSDRTRLVQKLPGSPRLWACLPNVRCLRLGVPIATNSRGQRGEEIPADKGPAEYRIIGLGDSYTFGTGVRYENTYLQVLQGLMQQDAGAGSRKVEAMNFGVEGYNTRQELAYFQEQGAALKPDLVLLEYLFNDVEENTTPKNEGQPTHPEVGRRGLTKVILQLKESSHLFSFLSPRLGALLRRMGVKRQGAVGVYADQFEEGNPGWIHSREALLGLQAAAAQSGARFAVVIFPAFVSLEKKDYPLLAYHQAVAGFCASHQIPALDLYPVFEGKRARDYWITLTDPHPNAVANRMAAEALHRFLLERRLIPAPSSATGG